MSKAGTSTGPTWAFSNLNDGSIERADLDGRNRKTIVPQGGTFTPKQLQLDKHSGKLYWCDREGMRVMRANLDGSAIETLVETGRGDVDRRDQTRWCVGIAVDAGRGQIYWTQKGPDNAGLGRIFRANIETPGRAECVAIARTSKCCSTACPSRSIWSSISRIALLYWTDRGDPPRGNTVNRAPMDADAKARPAPEILFTHLMEGIGIALDLKGGRMFLTDLAGSVYSARLDGSESRHCSTLRETSPASPTLNYSSQEK